MVYDSLVNASLVVECTMAKTKNSVKNALWYKCLGQGRKNLQIKAHSKTVILGNIITI